MNRLWTDKDVKFLQENYPKFGAKYCAEKLRRTVKAVQSKCSLLKIKPLKETLKRLNREAQLNYNEQRPNSDFNVNVEQFLDIKTPEVAYFLGFLWADGYIVRQEIRFSIVLEDMNIIKPVLDKIGKWNYNERIRECSKPICTAITNNRKLYKFLVENDYKIKSGASANKIISKIPDNLKHYFFRGLVDGDGCINNNKISVSSTYDQNWDYLTDLTNFLSIKSYIYRKTLNEKSKYSIVEINGKNGVVFGDYIYKNVEIDGIGLTRKFEKYLNLKHTVENGRNYVVNNKKDIALNMFSKGIPIPKIISELKIASTTVRRYLKEAPFYEDVQNSMRITEEDVLNIRRDYSKNKNIKELYTSYSDKIGIYGFRKICLNHSWKHITL